MSARKMTTAAVMVAALVCMAAGGKDWRDRVPDKDRSRVNPLAADAAAPEAGAKLYGQYCAQCHGSEAEGRGRRPSLRTGRVHQATDGELAWLLRNGNLGGGMPAWSKLPDAERWQIVRFLHTLPAAESTADSGQ